MSPKAVGYNEAELSPHCTGPPPPLPVTLLTVSGAALLNTSRGTSYPRSASSPASPHPSLPVTLLTVSGAALLYFSGACARIMRRGFPLTDSMGYG